VPSTVGPAAASNRFTPRSLSPALWLDASDSSTITQASGLVSEWRDKSGNNLHVKQDLTANRPSIGLFLKNGLNVIGFDGVNNILESTSSIDLTQGATVYVVASNDERRNYNGLFRIASSVSVENSLFEIYWQAGSANSGNLAVVSNRGVSSNFLLFSNTGPALGDYYAASASVTPNSSSSILYMNGNQILAVAGPLTPTSSNLFWIGKGYSSGLLKGKIAEVIAVPRLISADEKKAADKYLRDKWALY
jgi:hypothetical protein